MWGYLATIICSWDDGTLVHKKYRNKRITGLETLVLLASAESYLIDYVRNVMFVVDILGRDKPY